MHKKVSLSALTLIVTTALSGLAACSSEPEMQAPGQAAIDNNGLPIPGNMMAMIMAANAGHSGGAATSANAGRPASMTSTPGMQAMRGAGAAGGSAGAGAVVTGQAASASPDEMSAVHAAGSGAAGMSAGGQAGAMASTGAAGQPAAAGGAGAAAPQSGADACGPGAMPVMGGNPTSSGNGVVLLFSTTEAEVVSATMDMLVPKKPLNDQTLFIWPGIQPSNEGGISGFGVLQPVLTWGGSCNGQRQGTWWISGQYVYFTGGFGAKCETGELMDVGFGDWLYVEFIKKGTVWTQNVTNKTNNKKVTFDRDLKGQKQVEVLWDIEIQTQNRPTEDVIFKNSVIKLAAPNPSACAPRNKGPNDYFSQPRVSADGMTCCIDKVILRAAGTMMTSPNEP